MTDVKYVDEDGYTWLKRVTERAKPEHYNRGITIGPPDLSELDLTQDERKVLQEGLVNSRLVNCDPWSEWIVTRCLGLRRQTPTGQWIAIDLAAVGPGLPDQLRLPNIFLRTLA